MSFGDSDTMSYSGTTASITENSTTKNLDCDRLIGQNKSKFDFTDGAFDGIVYNIYINCVVTLVCYFKFHKRLNFLSSFIIFLGIRYPLKCICLVCYTMLH